MLDRDHEHASMEFIDSFKGYDGQTISFPSGSEWRLDERIASHTYFDHKPEARATFLCSKVSGNGPSTALVKIYLQIPIWLTAYEDSEARAHQTNTEPHANFLWEIEGLSLLTKAGCSCTPTRYDSKQDKQAEHGWVPGGYKLFILMELLPGSCPALLFGVLSQTEHPEKMLEETQRRKRDEIRAALKESWHEVIRCGAPHEDEAIRNLLWDDEKKKCYLIDWEYWAPPDRKTVWEDHEYIGWHLAQQGDSCDLYDMYSWNL